MTALTKINDVQFDGTYFIVSKKSEYLILDPDHYFDDKYEKHTDALDWNKLADWLNCRMPYQVEYPGRGSKQVWRRWLVKNCKKKWFFWDGANFEDELDAARFKLFW